jgi:hypothetical protein
LSQYCLYLRFVHFVSCLNTACVSCLSILFLFLILPLKKYSVQTKDTGSIETRHGMDKPET